MPYSLEIHQLDIEQGDSALILVKKTDSNGTPTLEKSGPS